MADRLTRVLWLGGWRFGRWHGFWRGEGCVYAWMFDVGPIRIVRRIRG